MKRFLERLYRILKSRICLDESFYLYRFKSDPRIESIITLEEVKGENIKDVLSFESKSTLKYLEQIIKKGEKGILGYLNGECVHRSFYKDAPGKALVFKFLPIMIGESEVYIHDCETAEKAKGKNIYPFVISYIARKYFPSKQILIATNVNNMASRRGIEKGGFEPFRIMRIKVFFGFKKRSSESLQINLK